MITTHYDDYSEVSDPCSGWIIRLTHRTGEVVVILPLLADLDKGAGTLVASVGNLNALAQVIAEANRTIFPILSTMQKDLTDTDPASSN